MQEIFYTLKVSNISCGSCIPKIEKILSSLEYVKKVRINIFTKEVQMELYNVIDKAKMSQIKKLLHKNGFVMSNSNSYWKKSLYFIVLAYLAQIVLHRYVNVFILDVLCAMIIQLTTSYKIFQKALSFTDTTILGSHASFVLGCFGDSENLQISTLIFITIIFGKFVLECIGNRMNEHFKTNMTENYLLYDKNIKHEDIKEGYVVDISPEKHILFDGTVISGHSYVDESSLTGEAKLKPKSTGSKVYSGTYNKTGNISVKVEQIGRQTYLGRILNQIAPMPTKNDDVVYFFYFIILMSFCSFIICIFSFTLIKAIQSSLSLLIIACPCAINISEPLTILAGTKELFDNNIIVKKLSVFDVLCDLSILFIDKTGTLTEGIFIVDHLTLLLPFDTKLLKLLVCTLERNSHHPIANALAEYCMSPHLGTILDYTTMKSGIKGSITHDGKEYIVKIGNDQFVEGIISKKMDNTVNCRTKHINNMSNKYMIDIYVVVNDTLICIFHLCDKIMPGARNVLDLLHKQNIKVVMLTGDSYKNAVRVANMLNIRTVYSNKSAEDKRDVINKYKKTFVTGMIGDGINDYMAISASDVGVYFSNTFSDIGHVSLLKKDMNLFFLLLVIGRKINRKIRVNFTLAVIYNVTALLVCLFGSYFGIVVTPKISCICMFLSSMTVIISSFLFK